MVGTDVMNVIRNISKNKEEMIKVSKPLKGKKLHGQWSRGELGRVFWSEDSSIITKGHEFVFEEEDVKSAVEWLKERDKSLIHSFEVKLITLDGLKQGLLASKNQAFEDVIKEQNGGDTDE